MSSWSCLLHKMFSDILLGKFDNRPATPNTSHPWHTFLKWARNCATLCPRAGNCIKDTCLGCRKRNKIEKIGNCLLNLLHWLQTHLLVCVCVCLCLSVCACLCMFCVCVCVCGMWLCIFVCACLWYVWFLCVCLSGCLHVVYVCVSVCVGCMSACGVCVWICVFKSKMVCL